MKPKLKLSAYIQKKLIKNVKERINHLDGLIVAPGFGERGVKGK